MKIIYQLTLAAIVCLLITSKNSSAQNYVEIGTGTVQNTMPIYSSWNYTWSSLIYNHVDLGSAKTITKIGLNCVNGPKTVTNQKMYIKLSPADIFANAGYEDPLNTGYTLVFQGDLTFQNGWNEIVLTTPIVYDGTQNLIIHWENRWGNTYGPQFNSTASSINNNKNCGSDVGFPVPSQNGYLNPYPSSLTNMRFYYTSSGPGTPTNPIPSDNATVVSVDTDLSWTLGANTTTYDLYFGTDPQNLPLIVSNAPCSAGLFSYTVPGLLADSAMHYWKVVAKNGSQQESSPVWKFKTEVVIDQFPYNEGFEDSLVFHTYPVVSAWQITPDVSWYEYNTNANSGLLCAKSSFFTTGNLAIIRSPKVLLPPGYSISYYWRNTSANKVAGHDTTYFEVSVNGGTTWSVIDLLSPATQNVSYVQRTHDLNAYAGNNFFFRFRHGTDNSSEACNVYLDDISIFQTGITPTLLVSPANQNVSSVAGTTVFSVTSNSDWTVNSNQTWCTVTSSGSGNGTISANYSENTTGVQRVAAITVEVAGLTPVVVTVTQGIPAATLAVSPSNQDVTSAAGTTSFSVTSNSGWIAESNQNWCSVTPSGSATGTITANYEENTSLSPRIASITVTVAGLTPVIVTVTQEAATPFLLVTPPNQDVNCIAGSTNFDINSNSSWTALSNQGWCTVTSSGNGTGSLIASYAENTLSTPRIAVITISANGVNPVNVTVNQDGATAILTVTPAVKHVDYLAGVTTFDVISNVDWTASSDANWCQPNAAGTGNGILSVSYLINETMLTRTANISVLAAGVTPVQLQVIQSPSYVSVNESDENGLTFFPNPASNFINVEMHDFKKGTLLQIYNAKGQEVGEYEIETSEFILDVSGLQKGSYILKIKGTSYSKSFVIVR